MSENAPFHEKGRGRSIMHSDFLVMHPSGPFFSLNNEEYQEALEVYPDLTDDNDLIIENNSASASVCVGGDNYFDNQTILFQFERFFKMIRFKKAYENHEFIFLVDNAKTHTKSQFSINDFGM